MISQKYYQKYVEMKSHKKEAQKNQMRLDPFGKKASQYINTKEGYIFIAVGAIRSGKTIASIVKFINYVKNSKGYDFAICGKTLKALNRNVIRPMLRILDTYHIAYDYKKHENEIHLTQWNKILVLYGIEKKGADEPIRGSTYSGAYLDEVTVMDEAGVFMMISRNSTPGAQIFMTCNPGNPNNFVYKNWIKGKENSTRFKQFKFVLEDNHTLTQEYIDNIKATYSPDSVFYKRNILGEWVTGQGAIFESFNEDNIYDIQRELEYYDFLEIGSDYGTNTTTCYTLEGIKVFDDHIECDVIAEKGFDATKEGYTQTDVERADDIIEFQDEFDLARFNVFYCSHDANSLKAELERRRASGELKMTVDSFKPDTLECIQEMNSMIYRNTLRVHRDCVNTISQIQSYEWDSNAAKRGVEKPVKVDDHYIDSMRAPIMTHLYDNESLGGFISLR